MKNKIIVIILTFFSLKAYAQEEVYFRANDLKGLEGTGIGVHNSDSFKIILQYKEKYKMGPNLYADCILGWHTLIHNGVEKSSTITNPLDADKRTILIGKDRNGTVFGNFVDKNHKNGSAKVSFKKLENSSTKALWKIEKILPSESRDYNILDKNGNIKKTIRQNENDYSQSKVTSTTKWIMTKAN